jgi:hypothetical protein
MINGLSISLGGSELSSYRYTYASGLSLIYLFPEKSSAFGVAFNPTKVQCSKCNTPVAEVVGGSLIIRSKHHGTRHVTAFSKSDLQKLLS